MTFLEALLCRQVCKIKFENSKNRLLAKIPNPRLRQRQCLAVFFMPSLFPIASSSETRRVVARFIPEVSKCNAKKIDRHY